MTIDQVKHMLREWAEECNTLAREHVQLRTSYDRWRPDQPAASSSLPSRHSMALSIPRAALTLLRPSHAQRQRGGRSTAGQAEQQREAAA